MHLAIPTDLQTQAEWWCAVNGYETPPGVTTALLSAADYSELYRALTAIPGVEQAALALWLTRWDTGLNPATGVPLDGETRAFWESLHRGQWPKGVE